MGGGCAVLRGGCRKNARFFSGRPGVLVSGGSMCETSQPGEAAYHFAMAGQIFNKGFVGGRLLCCMLPGTQPVTSNDFLGWFPS